ncbi:AI-2E family transporter [Mucilaginibacter conchicola]|uniref:AI-2E family transporter n=1 Tax=Mucilaginibacter conchicola TaxID=2303333 RepID=A0A372NSL3_9SPHI|nr:AI-2E family transporter [Mucilaginibacter conchicola]RFZ91263.1 AI-2E family transporter [Mucilaginibacter conchicola]
MKENPADRQHQTYIQKVWQTMGIVALLVSVILIARVAFNVLLMILAGSLIATYFHGLADMTERRLKLKRKWAMLISVLGTFVIFAALCWFMGTKISQQIDQLSKSLPETVSNFKAKLAQNDIGRKILESADQSGDGKMMTTVQSLFSTSFGVLGDLYIILFLGIFFTTNPSLYKDGIILLVPPSKKKMGHHILDRISLSLKGWLKGMMVSMVLVAVMIGTGLSIVGIPAALVLGLLTGILEIVPTLGSVIAMIPGTLLGFTVGTNTAIIVAIIYIVSQTITANIVNPLIQKKMINLPPALTLISQLIMGSVSGALGIIMAVPLLAITVILVDELYVKKIHHIPEDKGKLVTAKGMTAGE